ncbi:MAG: glycosyltransferase family A protein [Malacoplasma sp.]
MKLTIAYYLYQDCDNLEKSLESLFSQQHKLLEIIFISDFMTQEVEEILSKFDLTTSNIKLVKFQETLGVSYACNFAMKLAKGEYIYFAEQKVIFKPKFFINFLKWISSNKKYDFITFDKKTSIILKDNKNITEWKKSDLDTKTNLSFIVNSKLSVKYRIFNLKFLKDMNIKFVCYKNFHSLFIFDVIENSENWLISNDFLIDWYEPKSKSFDYSLYDILNSSDVLHSKLDKLNISAEKKEAYEMWIVILVLYEFLKKMFSLYKNEKKILLKCLNNADTLINSLCPNYKQNKCLNLLINIKLLNYIKNFKPTVEYVKNFLF